MRRPTGPQRQVLALLFLGVAICAHAARQEPEQPNGEVRVTDPKLSAALADAKAAAGQPRLFHENLVDTRPLVRANGHNWYSYNYTVFTNYDQPSETFLGVQSVERGNLPAGVLNLTLEWKPLPGLTAEMVEWMFGNLHKPALSPFDNKTIYPMYSILHPTDHITFLAKPPEQPVGRGSTFTFIENPNSQCYYQPASFDAPYVCPANRTGYTRASPEAEWRLSPQTNATLVVEVLDRNACIWHKTRELPHFGSRTVITSKMTWEDTPEGLVLRASRLAGVMKPNKTDAFETAQPELLAQANEVVRVAYLDGNFGDNITASAYAFAMHWGQEWTGLKDWLPQVFESSKKLAVAGSAAEGDDFDEEVEATGADSSTAQKSSSSSSSSSSSKASVNSSVMSRVRSTAMLATAVLSLLLL